MPVASSATPDELLQTIEELEDRAELSLREYLELERKYHQAVADKAQLEELVAQNQIPLPQPAPTFHVNNGSIKNIQNFYVNLHPWDASNDDKNLNKSTNPKDARASGSVTKVKTPTMPIYRNMCTRRRCNRGNCRMVHADQIEVFGDKAIKDLPLKAATNETWR